MKGQSDRESRRSLDGADEPGRHEESAYECPHEHDHGQSGGRLSRLMRAIPFVHGHSEPYFGSVLETSGRGIRAAKISLLALMATAVLQLVVVLLTGSVALFADTLHNFSDALTSVPLWIAFMLARRAPSRRYRYGFGRAEDLAGVLIVVLIGLSALLIGYESVQRLLDPRELTNVHLVMGAAVIGFLGNEAVAIYRIRVGRQIGSAALVVDGQHARADGLTSVAVLFGALGVAVGYPLADPIVGLLIAAAIVWITKNSAVERWHRLMDAVDPEIPDALTRAAEAIPGAVEVTNVRVHWVGHRLRADLTVVADEDLPTRESHRLAEEVRHALFHQQPRLSDVVIHVDPCGHGGGDPHERLEHHERSSSAEATPVR